MLRLSRRTVLPCAIPRPLTWSLQRTCTPGLVAARARYSLVADKLSIRPERLDATIHDTCEWGAAHRFGPGPQDTGMARLSLDDNDAKARRWFQDEMEQMGCAVTVDKMGNMFAVRPGKRDGPPTAIGSHLDTQPTGGRYDGILGIMAGVEVMRTLHENNVETEYPVAVVNWTNEEGARFPKSVVSSYVYAGTIPLESAWALQDLQNPKATIKSELERIGFLGETDCSFDAFPLAAHFELHIEQGPILEDAAQKVGVVVGGQAYRWFDLEITGRDCHTGSTPYRARADALLCAAKIIVASNDISKKHQGLASTGVLNLKPGSTNVCPGFVRMTLDMRHPSDAALDAMEGEIYKAAQRISAEESELGCELRWTRTSASPSIVFADECANVIREAAVEIVGVDKVRDMHSGAGHDSCAVSTKCPTAMVFVPSKDGLSHNPREYTSPEDCAIGAQVLLRAVTKYDQMRAARS